VVRSARTTYELGDSMRVSITNTTDQLKTTSALSHYFIQRYENDRWVDIHYKKTLGLADSAKPFPPGHSESYSFEVSESGFDGNFHRLCTDVRPGRYRFVFAGVPDPAIAAEFEIVQSD